MTKLIYDENTYNKSYLPIKYLYKRTIDSNKLIIVFSGFDNPPKYRYTLSLRGFDCNQLFILDDYGGRGCYYLGKNPEFLVEKSVSSLINEIINNEDIKKENVICAGSSKGGWAALYYAIKYDLGYAVVGAPQIRIVQYLNFSNALDVKEYMLGKNFDKKEALNVDNILIDLVKEKEKFPKIYVQVGIGDGHHLCKHILPFEKALRDNNKYMSLKLEKYSDNNDVANFYPAFLCNKIINIFPELKNSLFVNDININREKNKFSIKIDVNNATQYAMYVYLNGKELIREKYRKENQFQYLANKEGRYKFALYAKDNEGNKISYYTRLFNVDKNDIKKRDVSITIYGSCCSRDVFNYINNNKIEWKIKSYVARTSLYSNLDINNPWDINEQDIELESKFQRHTMAMDMNKKVYNELKNNASDYLIIDFIDERYDIVICDSKRASYTFEAISSKYFDNKKIKIVNKKVVGNKIMVNGEEYDSYIDAFAKKIVELYNPQQIILHCAYMCDQYFDENDNLQYFSDDEIKINHEVNNILQRMYERIQIRIPGIHVLDFVGENFHASSKNMWGLRAMHYEENYYKNLSCEIEKIILSH